MYNSTSQKCQVCPKGTKVLNNTCVSEHGQNGTTNGTSNGTANGTLNKCPKDSPHWNYVQSKC